MRTLALMFVGPSNRRELLRLRASFSFHRASMSAAGQNIVLSVASLGTAGVAGPAPRPAGPACWAYDAAAQSAITHIGARALLRIPLPPDHVLTRDSSAGLPAQPARHSLLMSVCMNTFRIDPTTSRSRPRTIQQTEPLP